MNPIETFNIRFDCDIGTTRREIVKKCKELGFKEVALGEIAIVINELCTNFLKHNAVEGKIIFKVIGDEKRRGIEIIAQDKGPGIVDIEEAMRDGVSTTGTMGGGLGAVKRLMEDFEIYSKPSSLVDGNGAGTLVILRKWIGESREQRDRQIVVSVVTRPYPGEQFNGDGYYIKEFSNRAILALIDGLGHGVGAYEASKKAIQVIEDHHHQSCKEILGNVHQELRGTRGAVIGLVVLNKQKKELEYGGIGNIDCRYIYEGVTRRIVSNNGILGVGERQIRTQLQSYDENSIIVLCSDGISTQWEYEAYKDICFKKPSLLSNLILRDFSKEKDDATVIVAIL